MTGSYIRTAGILSLASILLLSASRAWCVSYRYDSLNRLTGVSYDNGMSIDYSYDAAGNIIKINRVAAGADAALPAVTFFTLPATTSALQVGISAFTATDNVGVTGYCIAATDSPAGCSWSSSAPASYSFPQGTANGSHTLYAFAKDAAGNISPARSTALSLDLPQLTVTIAGVNSGRGSVNSTPQGIACVSGETRGCSATFNAGTGVTLIPLAVDSTFGGWSGACTSNSGNCVVTMNASKTATATFTGNAAQAIIEGSATPYFSLGTILDAVTAANQTVLARNLTFIEDVLMTKDLPIRLLGGYTDLAQATRPPGNFSTIDGTMKIRRGLLRVDRVKIR